MSLLTRIKMAIIGLALAAGLCAPAHARQAISNTAQLSYETDAGMSRVNSNTTTLTLSGHRHGSIRLLRLAFAAEGVTMDASGTLCVFGDQGFRTPSTTDGTHFDPSNVRLRPATSYHAGEPVFFEVTSPDNNVDPNVRDTLIIDIKTNSGDQGRLSIRETAPNSGVFLGYVPATDDPPVQFDCRVSTPRGQALIVTINDGFDEVEAQASALIDPYGYVFDSKTGMGVDGARVTIIDDATGLPAEVIGDDGISKYPSTVISGHDVTDAAGSVYQYALGQYRFPLLKKGRYSLFIEPPPGYGAPSVVSADELRKMRAHDGTEFKIFPASYGEAFDLVDPEPLHIDIPIDGPDVTATARRRAFGLSIDKYASVRNASFGDFVGYSLNVRNTYSTRTINDVVVEDTLPRGLRYVPGSTRRDGVDLAEPTISADGRTLRWSLGGIPALTNQILTYRTVVGADTPQGQAVNRASARGDLGAYSGEAEARVTISSAMMEDIGTILGRVTEGACAKDKDEGRLGVAGVRVVLEDGTFVISDRDGLFHFEGVRPGMHVVQLDVGALAAGLEIVNCGENTRNAGRAYSQFVDLRGGALQRVEFRLRRTAVATDQAAEKADIIDDAASDVVDWFAGQINAEPAFVYPAPDHNPAAPAIRVSVKHSPGEQVALTINGAPVDPLSRDGVDTSADGLMAVSLWRGVPLIEGTNALVATVTDRTGAVVATLRREVAYSNTPTRAELVADASHLIADGLGQPVIAVRFSDRFGHPVRPGTVGTFDIAAPYAPAPDPQANERLAGEGAATTTWRVTGADGIARIALAPTTQAGSAVLHFVLPGLGEGPPAEVRAWLSAAREDWIVVGFAAGTAGFNTLSRHASPLAREDRGETLTDGQLAFYAKGRVKGSWLLTLAYDNKRPADPQRGLTSQIDPDRYYTVYGDNSKQAFDAATQRKLYIRLEKNAFYALFGDFRSGFDSVHLGHYERVMNGAKFERQGKVFNVSGFAAETTQDHVRDELPGSGLASLYQLSRRDVVPNSEIVVLETRDRVRPERILASRALVRNIDYDINYDTGALSFREAIPNRDDALNPNVIVANYEVLGNGERAVEAGLRGLFTLAKGKLKAGFTLLRGRPGPATADTNMVAADITLRPRQDTEVRLEAAASDSTDARRQSAFIAEVEHHSARVDVLGYARQADAQFGLAQQNRAELGARKVGIDSKAKITDRVSLNATAYHETYLQTSDTRDVADVRLDYRMDSLWAGIGVKSAHDSPQAGAPLNSDLLSLTAGKDFFDRRLKLTAQSDIALGDAASIDFPERRRVGASFEVREGLRLLASREIIEGVGYKAAVTGGGVEFEPWKGGRMTSALNQQDLAAFGPRTYAQLGFSQSVQLTAGWTLDGTFDATSTLAGQRPDFSALGVKGVDRTLMMEDYKAISVGAAYRADLWSANARVETRQGTLTDSWAIRGAYLRQLREGITAGLTVRADETKVAAGGVSRGAEISGSVAWRPLDSAWQVLDRLDVRSEQAQGLVAATTSTGFGSIPSVSGSYGYGSTGAAYGSSIAGYGPTSREAGETGKVINNLAVSYDSGRGDHGPWTVQATLYHGVKVVKGEYESKRMTSVVQVIGAEARVDVTERIDVGFNASVRDGGKLGGRAYSFGPSVGFSPAENTWMAVGYNVVGYSDPDFEASRYSRQGFYVAARVKFDQNTFAGLGQKIAGLGK